MKSKKELEWIINILTIPLFIPLFILKKYFKIQFWRFRGNRIGHLALNSDLFLRRLKLGIIKNNIKHKMIARSDIANKQLFKMLKQKMDIITIPESKYIRTITKIMASKSVLSQKKLFITLPYNVNEYHEFNNTTSDLNFTELDENKGKELLQKMKVDNSWFICFHSRDSSYLNVQWKKGDSYHDFRNCSVESYISSAEYITKQGGYALRMGSVVSEKMANLNDPKIIDYATSYRTDFGDVYLLAKCKFFLGNTAGLFAIATIFNKPIASANVVPIVYPPLRKGDLFIPKKIWSKNKKKFLTFREIIQSKIMTYDFSEDYKKNGLIPIENNSEEILDLAMEMNERLNGNWITTKEDEELQKKFKSLFSKNSSCYGFPSRIGTLFLRKNKELFD